MHFLNSSVKRKQDPFVHMKVVHSLQRKDTIKVSTRDTLNIVRKHRLTMRKLPLEMLNDNNLTDLFVQRKNVIV